MSKGVGLPTLHISGESNLLVKTRTPDEIRGLAGGGGRKRMEKSFAWPFLYTRKLLIFARKISLPSLAIKTGPDHLDNSLDVIRSIR